MSDLDDRFGISAEDIAAAKQRFAAECSAAGRSVPIVHEHDDCIRIACQWLAAQRRTKNPSRPFFPLKHIIESWGGRYVSQDDVEVAALILGLRGEYPRFNISTRHILPPDTLLEGIGEAMKHAGTYRGTYWKRHYKGKE